MVNEFRLTHGRRVIAAGVLAALATGVTAQTPAPSATPTQERASPGLMDMLLLCLLVFVYPGVHKMRTSAC